MKRITALKMDDCRYPVGEDEGGHLFCGASAPGKSAYCTHHHGIAYVRRPMRRNVLAAFLAREACGYAPTPTVTTAQRLDVPVDVWMAACMELEDDDDADE